MEKDFDGWNEIKKETDKHHHVLFFSEREVWWCLLGANVGTEQDGSGNLFRRPVVIIKRLSKKSCLVAPLTTSKKPHPFHPYVGKIKERDARALISQIRVIDTKRFGKKMGFLDMCMFENMRKTIKDML